MDVQSVAQKVKQVLTEEEIVFFLEEMKQNREDVFLSLAVFSSSKIEGIARKMLKEHDYVIGLYGEYDFYDKGYYDGDDTIKQHVKTFQTLTVEEIKEILVLMLDYGVHTMLIGHYLECLEDDFIEDQLDELYDHKKFTNL